MIRRWILILISYFVIGFLLITSSIAGEPKYNRSKAKEYAETWCNKINNKQYEDFSSKGGDCANFVSQALINGGLDFGCVGKASIIGKDGWTKGIPGAANLIAVLQKSFCFIRSLSCKEGDIVAYKNAKGVIKHVAIVDANCNVAAHTAPYCFNENKGPASLLGDKLKSYEIYTFQDDDKCKKCELQWSDVAFNVCTAKMTDKATPCETCDPVTFLI